MDPIAFEIFGIEIAWYGIIIASGMFLAAILVTHFAPQLNLNPDDFIDFLLIAIPISIIGARFYYVAFNWDYYGENLSEIFNIRGGGLAIHGGIIAGLIVLIIFTKVKEINSLDFLDIGVMGLLLGQAIGRWGNYVNAEAHGGPTDLPWGIIVEGKKVHPTFLYESLWNFATLALLIWIFKNKDYKRGLLLAIYLISYSFIRFFIEGLRTDSLYLGNIKVAQLVSIIGFIAGIGLLIYINKKQY